MGNRETSWARCTGREASEKCDGDSTLELRLGLKCLMFGLAVAIIPAATALEAERDVVKSLPGVVLGGLVKLFFVILAIEAATLVVKYV